MRAIVLTAALVFISLSFGMAPAWSAKRVALIVANSSYVAVPKLPNPVNDALAIEQLFKAAGFDAVLRRTDLTGGELRRELRNFSDLARNSDIAVIYFAGHGIEVNGENYLIPTNATLESDLHVEDEAVPLRRVIQVLEPAKRLKLVILDACRNNPFLNSMRRTITTRSIGRGLAKIEVFATDTLVAYAAKAGSTAADGKGKNSPFTRALTKHLATPGLDIRLAFGRIRDEVLLTTNGRQEPFIYGSLGGSEVYIGPPARVGSIAAASHTHVGDTIARAIQEHLHNLGCYNGAIDGNWGADSDTAMAKFAKLNGLELETTGPTSDNFHRFQGIGLGCSEGLRKGAQTLSCSPRIVGPVLLAEPNGSKPHPDFRGSSLGLSWSLMDVQKFGNADGLFLYGAVVSPRGNKQKYVYGRAEEWDCK